jgi:uncharacterized protein
MLVTGSGNKIECWYSDQSGAGQITETCATAYLLRNLDQLNRMRVDSRYGDMMERAIYNSLFAAISPDGRNLRYWAPPQGQREYYPKDFMCCPCNLLRIMSELPGMSYYQQAAGGIIVNLYTASSADLDLRSAGKVHLEQTTDYPNSGKIAIDVTVSKQGAVFPLGLRIPHWCKKATLSVNGKAVPLGGPGYAEVRREWRQGDRVELNLDMPWRIGKRVTNTEREGRGVTGSHAVLSESCAESQCRRVGSRAADARYGELSPAAPGQQYPRKWHHLHGKCLESRRAPGTHGPSADTNRVS